MELDKIIIVRDKTRLEQLIERFNSKAQAKFYLERSGEDFGFYEQEHNKFYTSLGHVQKAISPLFKSKVLFRSYLPTYMFAEGDVIVVIGQDGLVANTAKYVKGLPIVAVNPDEERYDGILLPHGPQTFLSAIKGFVNGTYESKKVTMAKAAMNDGQTLLAFNDFYIGVASHVSSRYNLEFKGKKESQSSSGILVSTGAGATGWISSVFNMTNNINQYFYKQKRAFDARINWEDEKLLFVVREPFLSKMSQIDLGYGTITKNQRLKIESKMPQNGVIFSDGIEADFLNFNSGNTLSIGIADEKANLII
ncbi:sugar kinase [Muricauda sp. SCSIO 64092]|uniref:sugar kinase n=1 Tax=Allomuricauda sp. SCSIO 64092 TaxID=2908842 RepID=UPI001FF5243E|nr:sugar kinase [Muricauda sp. SCSIO 64092]UOY08920.1 sugar kinase [Muricauda sp. SCSIO 64092]